MGPPPCMLFPTDDVDDDNDVDDNVDYTDNDNTIILI